MKKRILSILLVACMLLAVIPMTVSAEEINKPDTTETNTPAYLGVQNTDKYFDKTVYVSSTGKASNDGLTEETAVNTLRNAVALLPDGGEVIVLDDISNTEESQGRTFASNSATVYIHGKLQNDGDEYQYPSITYSRDVVLNFQGPIVIYDLEFKTPADKSLWLASNAYPLTVGNNVKTDTISAGANITNGKYTEKSLLLKENTHETTNIYSGTWTRALATSWNVGKYDTSKSTEYTQSQNGGTLNIYGGTITQAFATRDGGNANDNVKGDAIINYYGGIVSNVSGSKNNTTANQTLNIFGKDLSASGIYIPQKDVLHSKDNVFYSSNITAKIKIEGDKNGTAPTFESILDTLYSVRFLATINQTDLANYSEIGFKITANNADYSNKCTKVYKSVVAANGEYSENGKLIFALAIKDIPTSVGTVTFTVTPYVIDSTGTHDGTAYTVTYNAGAYGSTVAAN